MHAHTTAAHTLRTQTQLPVRQKPAKAGSNADAAPQAPPAAAAGDEHAPAGHRDPPRAQQVAQQRRRRAGIKPLAGLQPGTPDLGVWALQRQGVWGPGPCPLRRRTERAHPRSRGGGAGLGLPSRPAAKPPDLVPAFVVGSQVNLLPRFHAGAAGRGRLGGALVHPRGRRGDPEGRALRRRATGLVVGAAKAGAESSCPTKKGGGGSTKHARSRSAPGAGLVVVAWMRLVESERVPP